MAISKSSETTYLTTPIRILESSIYVDGAVMRERLDRVVPVTQASTGHQRSSEVNRGHQWQSGALTWIVRPFVAISGAIRRTHLDRRVGYKGEP